MRGETESQGVRLSSAQKRILGYISAETTLSDGVRCSKKELAKQAGCSVQTVDRAIFRLRKLGLVEVEECHAGPARKRRTFIVPSASTTWTFFL